MSSEQRTARETLEQAFRAGFAACQDNTDKYGEYNGDSIEEEFAAFAASLRAAPAPTGDYSAIEQDCRGCMGPCGRCHESGAAPAPEPEHVCGGCGYKWNWPVPSPIELCGDCWRKTWPVLRGAAPAPEGETPMPRCVVCRTEYPTTGQQAGPVAGVWGRNFMVCRLCVDAARDAKRKRNASASPGPTPDGCVEYSDQSTQSWAVSVERDGENIVTISSNCLGGRDLSAEDERVIRMAAEHLNSFVGPGPTPEGRETARWRECAERLTDERDAARSEVITLRHQLSAALRAAAPAPEGETSCGDVWDSPTGRTNVCVRPIGHSGHHWIADQSAMWLPPASPGPTPDPPKGHCIHGTHWSADCRECGIWRTYPEPGPTPEECTKWRPIPLKGVCACGLRWHQHSDMVKATFKR
jgi:hypothetical protein